MDRFGALRWIVPRLWTCLSRKLGHPALALIEACVERSKGHPLDVVLHIYAYRENDGYLKGVQMVAMDGIAHSHHPVCARWRRCSTVLVVERYSRRHVISDSEFVSISKHLKAPMLQEFSIEEQPHSRSPGVDAPEFTGLFKSDSWASLPADSWSLPRMHTLILRNVYASSIPPKFRAQLQSVVVIYVGRKPLRESNILDAFAGATSLTNVRLSFDKCHFGVLRTNTDPLELPQVKSLSIDFLGCSQSDWGSRSLWNAFRTFHFPHVVDLTVVLDIGEPTFVLWNGTRDRSFDMTLHSFLVANADPQHAPCVRFPCLQTLNLDVRLKRGGEEPTLLLPYWCLQPTLKHLQIKSTVNLTIGDNVGEIAEALLPSHLAIGNETVPIALQTIILDLPEVRGVVPWVKELVLKMKDQFCWDGFTGLTVKNAKSDFDLIHRDGVESWCEQNGDSILF